MVADQIDAPDANNFREYYLTEFRRDLIQFMPNQAAPYFGHSWSQDCRGLENIAQQKRALFLLCLYFTVLIDQAMHAHFSGSYSRFQELTRYPKFCHGLGQYQKNPRDILSVPNDKGLVDRGSLEADCQSAMDLFVNEVISFFREHMPYISASEFFEKLIYDADVQIPEIFILLEPNTKDHIEYKAYRALRRAVELAFP